MTDKIIVKKVVVGTPIKKVTAGAFSISNLAGVDVSATESDGSILAYNKLTGKWEVTNLRSDANISIDFDSEQNKYTFGLTNSAFTGSIIPDSNEVYDLGSSTKKWRDLYLSGSTITLGTLSLKDSGGDLIVVDAANKKINLDLSLSTNNTAVFSFDSSSGTFVFNDSDLARTNINETFHAGLTVKGGLSVAGGATIDSATITSLANTNLTGSQATFDSANIGTLRVTGNTVLDGNLTITGTETTVNTETINLADNTIVLNSNATGVPTENAGIEIERGDSANKSFLWNEGTGYWTLNGETLETTGKILFGNVYSSEGDLPNAGTYHGMFAHVHGTGRGLFAHGGSWHNLIDSDTTSLQQVYNLTSNNADITNAQIDSANITSVGGITGFDATSTSTMRGLFSAGGDLTYNSSTGQFTFDVEDVYTQANFDSDFLTRLTSQIDSAGITTLNNTNAFITNLTGSQATFDSANITSLGAVGSVDATTTSTIRGLFSSGGDLTYNSGTGQFTFDVEDVYSKANFDSDLGLANSGQLPEGTNLYYTTTRADSDFDVRLGTKSTSDVSEGSNLYYTTARADSDAKNSVSVTDAGGDGSLSYNSTTGVITYTGPSASEVRAHLSAGGDLTYNSSTGVFSIDVEDVYTKINFDSDFLSRLTTQIDSAGITTLTTTNATITTLASTQLNGSQATFDSATITNIRFDNVDAQTTTTIRGLFSAAGDLSYNSSTGAFSIDVEDVYTKSNFDSDLGAAIVGGTGITYDSSSDTVNITNTGVTAATYGSSTSVPQIAVNAQGQITSASNVTIAGVTGVDFDSSNATITIQTTGGNFTDVISLDPFTTANLSENTNLYYTDARARASNSVTDAGGDGSLAYNSTTGVITYTGPSATEVRAHLTANKGLSVSNGEFNIDSANVKGMFSAGGDLSYSNGQFSFTERTDAEVRGLVSATDAGGDGSFSYNASTGAFTYTGPSATEVRAHLTANKGLSVSSGEFNIDSDNVKGMFSATDAGGDGSFSYSNGVYTYTGPSATEVRAHLTANKGLSVTNGEFNIDSANVKAMFSGGTGVTYSNGAISIGQAVATSDNVTFNDLVVSGNLSILGSQTDVATTNLTVTDKNITIADSSTTSALTNGAGLTFGAWSSGTIPTFTWSHGDQRLVSNYAIGANLVGNVTGNVTGTTSDISNHTTADLTENTNLYHTTARARGAISVTDAGGDGSASYNSTTGVITYTGPSASEVRAHLTANKGLSVSSGEFNIDSANVRGMFSASGSLSYNSSTGAFSYTDSDRTAAQIKGLFSGGTGITYSNGAISTTDGDIVHDNLSGFVANEHIDHSSVSVTAGTGLTGGGTIAATRTVNVIGGKGIIANANDIQVDSANIKGMFSGGTGITFNDGAISTTDGDIVHDNLSGFVANEHIDHSGVTMTAGTGLTGGGTIAATRTFNVVGGKGITANADDIQIDSANVKGMFSASGDITYSNGAFSYSKQTSAQLLTSIKTVDGASSGLDADLLDGQHGSHYRINVYNNSGTLLN